MSEKQRAVYNELMEKLRTGELDRYGLIRELEKRYGK